jgi:hypothetical protein
LLMLVVLFAALPVLAQDVTLDPTIESPVVQNIIAEEGSTVNLIPDDNEDETKAVEVAANSVPTPVVIAFAVVALVFFIVLMYNQHLVVKAISPLMTPEAAQSLVDSVATSVVTSVANLLLPAIPGNIDDQALTTAMRQRGLILAVGEDGLYHTTRATPVDPSPTPSPLTGQNSGGAGVNAFGYEARRSSPPETPLTNG